MRKKIFTILHSKFVYSDCVNEQIPVHGDKRPEFKMWGGASKSVFALVLKIYQHQFDSKTLSC